MKNKKTTSDFSIIRQKAEMLLKKKPLQKVWQFSEFDTLKLVHKLVAYQTELELQNEELLPAKLYQAKSKIFLVFA